MRNHITLVQHVWVIGLGLVARLRRTIGRCSFLFSFGVAVWPNFAGGSVCMPVCTDTGEDMNGHTIMA